MVGIYRIRNETNGKCYFGQTVDFEKRRKEHITALRGGYHHNIHLQRSWVKYGEDAFTFEFVESCPVERLDEREMQYIADYHTFAPSGYNLTAGGDGIRGFKFSPEHLKVLSQRSKEKWSDEAFREKMRELHRGCTHSEETRKKMSESHMGRPPARPRPVRCVETGQVFPAVRKVVVVGRNISPACISRACIRGIRAYGYHWQYVENP